jgi:hypothetical protein
MISLQDDLCHFCKGLIIVAAVNPRRELPVRTRKDVPPGSHSLFAVFPLELLIWAPGIRVSPRCTGKGFNGASSL